MGKKVVNVVCFRGRYLSVWALEPVKFFWFLFVSLHALCFVYEFLAGISYDN
jgi:hypothetical protein